VLFDYDDVIPIESASFAHKPRAFEESDEFTPEEERIVATSRDFFVDEMRNYSGIPQRLKGCSSLSTPTSSRWSSGGRSRSR